jgi:hypothetical protein
MVNPPPRPPPGLPSVPAGPMPSSVRPATIQRAVLLMRAGAALGLGYGLAEGIDARSAAITPTAHSQGDLAGDVEGLVLGALLLGLAAGVPWLWMAAKNKAGRGWARILSSVFFGLWSVLLILEYSLAFLAKTRGGGDMAVFVVVLAAWMAGIVALILLWQPESGAYYAARSQARRMAAARPASSAGGPFGDSPFGHGQPGDGQPPRQALLALHRHLD